MIGTSGAQTLLMIAPSRYLHLKFEGWSMIKAIGLSWLIAFFEYGCLTSL